MIKLGRALGPVEKIIGHKQYKSLLNYPRRTIGEIDFMDGKLKFSDGLALIHSAEEIFVDEIYKFESSIESPFIIDCGTNIGLSILYFKRIHPVAKIIGFEPDKLIFDILSTNINSYKLNDVNVFNAAVWTEDTELEFFSEGSLGGSLEIDFTQSKNIHKVDAKRLKPILKQQEVDFLKIDIEGAENSLMADIVEELYNVKFMFIEYHSMAGHPQKLNEILSIITQSGFRYYIKSAADYLKYPFIDEWDQNFDLQLNIFCTRD